MTTLRTLDTTALANLSRALIGFDRLYSQYENRYLQSSTNNYPPYNVVKVDDNAYEIEMAIAGFSKDEVSVEVNQNEIIVKGYKTETTDRDYQYRGLALRSFEKSIFLAEYLEVRGATVKDGILSIELELLVPEAVKPRKIEIK
jgi:molecular chaperone IbpA